MYHENPLVTVTCSADSSFLVITACGKAMYHRHPRTFRNSNFSTPTEHYLEAGPKASADVIVPMTQLSVLPPPPTLSRKLMYIRKFLQLGVVYDVIPYTCSSVQNSSRAGGGRVRFSLIRVFLQQPLYVSTTSHLEIWQDMDMLYVISTNILV